MDRYQCPADLQQVSVLLALADKEGQTFLAFHRVLERPDGKIPRKYRELTALAVAMTTQCAYCIDTHVKQARQQGASREEIAEVAFIAASVKAGGTLAHGLLALRLFTAEA